MTNHKIEPLPKGKTKLIDPDKFAKISHALAPEKIEPLNIEDYFPAGEVELDPVLKFMTLRVAVIHLIETVNDLIAQNEEMRKVINDLRKEE